MTPNPYHRRPTGLPRVHGPSCPSSAASCHCAPPPRRLSRVPPLCGPARRPRPLWIRPSPQPGPFRFKDTAGGDGTHSRHTGTRITRITQTNLTTIQTHQPTAVHTATNPRPSGRGPHTVAGSREATGTAPVPVVYSNHPIQSFQRVSGCVHRTVQFRTLHPRAVRARTPSVLQAYTRGSKTRGGSREPGLSRDTHRIAHSPNGTHRARCSVLERRYKAKGGTAHLSLLSLTSYQTVLSLDPA